MGRKLSCLGLLIIAILFIPFTIGLNPLAGFKAKLAAQAYYKNLVKGDFKEAFKQVGYFDEASDLDPKMPYEEAERIWVNRLKSLKAQGIYLIEVKDVKVYVDEGYPEGWAEVVVFEKGQTKTWKEQIYFGRLKGEWKVQAVWRSVGDQKEPLLNQARHGYIPHRFKSAELENVISKLKNKQSVTLGKYKLSLASKDLSSFDVFMNTHQEENLINRLYIEMEFNEIRNDFAVLRLSYPELDKFLGNKKINL